MNWSTPRVLGLSAIVLMTVGAFLMPAPAPLEPTDERRWTLDSVMLLDEATTATYGLDLPFRVIRSGRVTLARAEERSTQPVVRVDLTIDGEPVIVFSRLRE